LCFFLAIAVLLDGNAYLESDHFFGGGPSEHAKFDLPKRVFLASDLPRNAMGKVQKANLSKQYRETFKV
jgi:malonyl-CoA/methylmalonyl-CoA synthetase